MHKAKQLQYEAGVKSLAKYFDVKDTVLIYVVPRDEEDLQSVSITFPNEAQQRIILKQSERLKLPKPTIVLGSDQERWFLIWEGADGLDVLRELYPYMLNEAKLKQTVEYFDYYGLVVVMSPVVQQERRKRQANALRHVATRIDAAPACIYTIKEEKICAGDIPFVNVWHPSMWYLEEFLENVRQAKLPKPGILPSLVDKEYRVISWRGKEGLIVLRAALPYMENTKRIDKAQEYFTFYGEEFIRPKPKPKDALQEVLNGLPPGLKQLLQSKGVKS